MAVLAATAFLARPAQASDEYEGLVDEPGVEETYIYCGACHSVKLVIQQGMSRERWDHLFEWMVEEQGMDEIEEPDRTTVLDYLTEHYGEDRPNFPRR